MKWKERKDEPWISEEYRGTGLETGIQIEATQDGIRCNWKSETRVLNPGEARQLSDILRLAAVEAEARGAQDVMR